MFRDKLRFQALIDTIVLKHEQFEPDDIIIEDSPAGHHLIEALRSDYTLPIKAERPLGDKHTRLSAVSGYIESGHVHLPDQAPWLDDFLLEITRFPNVKHDDQVDAFSQGLKLISKPKPISIYAGM